MSCVFPAFNEEGNIGELIDEGLATLGRFGDSFEIIVVDDGSTDATASIVRDRAERRGEVRLLAHPSNLGYGHAMRSGLAQSRGDHVVFVDGDRQFRLADLARLFERIGEADIVVGSRIDRADPWHRLVIARVYHVILRAVFGLELHDVDCGFKLFRKQVIDGVIPQLESRSAFVSPEILIRAKRDGYRVIEVDVPHHPRTAGRPKGASMKVVLRTIGEIVRLRRSLTAPDAGRSRGTSTNGRS